MIEFYIVKRLNTKINVLRPKFKISLIEYQERIDSSSHFTWFENTEHGSKILKEHSFTVKRRAYYNYSYNDPMGYVQLLWSNRGYVQLVVEGKNIGERDLTKLIQFSNLLDSCIWRLCPLEKIDNLKVE